MGRADLSFARHGFLLLLCLFEDLLIFCHGAGGLFAVAQGLICAGELIVETAIVVQLESFFEVGDGFGVISQSRASGLR